MAIKSGGVQDPSGAQYVIITDPNGTVSNISAGGGDTVGGEVPSGTADSGNPVKVGGKVNTTRPTFVDGQRADLQSDIAGNIGVTLYAASSAQAINAGVNNLDAVAVLGVASVLGARAMGYGFNGTTWDRVRNNFDTAGLVTLSAQAAGTVNGPDLVNYNGRGVQVVVDITVATAMTLTINIQGKDAISGKYYTILSSAAYATVSTNQLTVYPGAAVTANISVNQPMPRTWRIQAVVTGTSVTATVGASVIL